MAEQEFQPSVIYGAVRDELIAALSALDEAGASTTVPACPAWTVKDVAAHLVGLNAELLAEVQGGLGTDEATTRQVGDRSGADLGQILDEWSSLAGPIGEKLAANDAMARALMADLVIHVYDLVEVLSQPTIEAAAATPASAHQYVPRLQQRLADQMNVGLSVELSDGTSWPSPAGEGATAVVVSTDPHSFLRGVTGRLRRAEVEAFDWSTDPADILDTAWNQYGPFRI